LQKTQPNQKCISQSIFATQFTTSCPQKHHVQDTFFSKPPEKTPFDHIKKIRVKYKKELTKKMAHTVFCTKYKAEMEGLDEPPFDSDFGQKIYKNVSKKAWGEWVERQKMLLNEYRLQPWTREAQEFLVEQMNEFFFGEGGTLPKEYVAPTH
jgi:Fe-S cluster biosynthesis and repair protein YggX